MREGLWKLEKALADLELREYDHGKKMAKSKVEEDKRFAKFKNQMLSALVLIHQIQVRSAAPTAPEAFRTTREGRRSAARADASIGQDEMGLRHSEMYGKLSNDINQTKYRLLAYVESGVVDADGKVRVLGQREAALTRQLLAMVAAQGETLNAKIAQLHEQEEVGISGVKDFTESVETEMQARPTAPRPNRIAMPQRKLRPHGPSRPPQRCVASESAIEGQPVAGMVA